MKQDIKLPRSPKEPPPPNRPSQEHVIPSHERVIEYLDKWANSPGLQPPK
jgi:hypothetical protein